MKLMKKLRMLTHCKQHLGYFKLFCIVPAADSATQSRPYGCFCNGATKIASGAPIAGISSQAKITTAKLKNFKIYEQKQIF
jgi:hypothetical protein